MAVRKIGKHAAREKPPFKLVTPLAKMAWVARQEYLASGKPLLDQEGLEREVARRRGLQPRTDENENVS